MINIEQHAAVVNGDEEDLYELTHLSEELLEELREHLLVSPVRLSPELADLVRDITRLLQSLDMPRAS